MFNECVSPSPTRSSRTTTNPPPSSSHQPKLRSPICCLGANAVVEPESMNSPGGGGTRTPRSPYEWLKSTAQEIEIRDRFRRVKSKIKVTCKNNHCGAGYNNCVHIHNQNQRHHHQSYPGDFSYDPLSYALNFEDDVNEDGEFPSFTARLPSSPVVTKSRSSTVDLISF